MLLMSFEEAIKLRKSCKPTKENNLKGEERIHNQIVCNILGGHYDSYKDETLQIAQSDLQFLVGEHALHKTLKGE
jgi:hypothetical protein